MSDTQANQVHGTYAEFDSVDTLLAACRRVRDAGYTQTDAYTPFPVHGIDKALGIKPTHLPWISLACGLTGVTIGLVMQCWMNGIDYKYIISGKPFISLPAFMPVSFELTILLASFGAFFGMLALNGLPRFNNPLFSKPRFDRATDDKFFLYIDAKDSRYDASGVAQFLTDLGGQHVDQVVEDDTRLTIPKPIWVIVGVLMFVACVPPLVLARMRVTTSGSPRFHVFFDMDFSPAKGAQEISTLFADGRSMRPDVPGTVASGQFEEDIDYYTGIDFEELARRDSSRATRLVRALRDEPDQTPEVSEADAPSEAPAIVDAPSTPVAPGTVDDTPWLPGNPLPLSSAVLNRGREKFEIYCAVCHGNDGRGNGLVNRRAQRILATAWVQPSSLHQETLYAEQYPDGKLFSTITNGIRKMAGYRAQLTAQDRWAVVAYVRALQASQNATLEDLPADKRNELRKEQAEVLQQLAEQAEEERRRAEATSATVAQ